MLGYLQLWYIFSTFSLWISATPVLKGDQKPGAMHGLVSPLGTNFWSSHRCTTAGNFKYEKTKTQLMSTKKNRPPGWIKNGLIYGEFILNHTIKELVSVSPGDIYCPYLTSHCCNSSALYMKKRGLYMKKGDGRKHSEATFERFKLDEECKDAVSIKPRSWGTCAFVAQGASLRRVARGREIDEHDTVIRLGHMPLKSWEKYTGTKTDVIIGRGTIQTKHAGDYLNVKFLIGADKASKVYDKNDDSVSHIHMLKAVTRNPKKFSLVNGGTVLIGTPDISASLYRSMTEPIGQKPRGATTGFRSALDVILSGFCQSVDVYGTTPNCGGYYHNINYVMKVHHSCELESWVLHYLMRSSELQLCVWI